MSGPADSSPNGCASSCDFAMLRAYVLSPKILAGDLTHEDQSALGRIIGAMADRVTLVLTRADLEQLVAVIQRSSLGRARERLCELITSELSGCGAGVFALSGGSVRTTPKKTMESLDRAIRIDALLLCATETRPRWLPANIPAVAVGEVAEAFEREALEFAFRQLPDETALLARLREFFLHGGELAIVDPYLPVKCLRQDDFGHVSTGVQALVSIAADPVVRRGRTVRIRVVGCESKLQSHVDSKRKADRDRSPQSLAEAKEHVEQRMRDLVMHAVSAAGVGNQELDFGLRWTPSSLERGIVSSGRCWKIEHSLDDLGVVLSNLRGRGKWNRAEEPTLRLLRDDGARNLRRLAQL